tara:strand:+ start:860 stop:1339 length:480 start_codon:yes stop_codon:yes gene_type:complete
MTQQIMTEAQIQSARNSAIAPIKTQARLWVIMAAIMILAAHWFGWQNVLITKNLPIEQHGLTIGFTTFGIVSLAFVLSGVGLLVSLALIEKKNDIALRFAGVDIGLLGINEMTKPLDEVGSEQFKDLAQSSSLAKRILSAAQIEQRSVRKFELEAVQND